MGKRSGNPALYEMMRSRAEAETRSISPRTSSLPAEEYPSEVEPSESRISVSASALVQKIAGMLTPGRTLHVPVGYLLLAGALVVLLLPLMYSLGVGRGRSVQRSEFEAQFGVVPTPRSGVNDPLQTLEPLDHSAVSAPPTGASGSQGSATPANPPAARPSASWGPVQPKADPRQKGVNYFVVAETTPQGALRLAEFCRANGLETYVIPTKNDRSNRVIAFPGFQGSRDAPEVKSLEERIHQIGDKYKAANKYETNMRDAYPAKYDG